ncbi:hypothetical protein SAMN05216223_113117 [Actinacidiphila yanglinensis]|uniref:Uncharacterized protein n=1 Tax=Actinacidiphila yanglinensis TaxID=310779 RepID=A0A1H6DAV5_9ACTN|nr:hypothetical protein [Actinacidiphila yanglinensis]SEG82244.1 hypothetical protein SAMN05216223_113117 [Actinacidiphila yanglinensis]
MHVKWSSLGEVAVVSFGATVGVVIVFAIGVWALSARDQHRASGGAGTVEAVGAGACFLLCACAVLYGLYLIIPQFH